MGHAKPRVCPQGPELGRRHNKRPQCEVAPLAALAGRDQKRANEVKELQRAINLKKIAVFAEEDVEAHEHDTVSEEPIDTDWFTRWRENAQDVTDEQMTVRSALRKIGYYVIQTPIKFFDVRLFDIDAWRLR